MVQDAWVNIARDLRRLDDPARFAGWAYAVVSRRCMDGASGTGRRLSAVVASEVATTPGIETPSAAEDRMDLSVAIGGLPIEQRLLVSLHYGEGLHVEEIATTLRLPVGTVKSRLYAARQALRAILQGADDDQG